MVVVQRARPAMGSLFQVRLVGDDADHLAAVAEAALDEIERVERLLSWRDARSETARMNREAATRPVLVDYELAEILAFCKRAEADTGGYFDLAAATRAELTAAGELWQFDPARRLVRFLGPEVRLDFGAFGKGYALDCAAIELRRFGVRNALVDGGTSSVLALGCDEFGNPWPVGLRNPFPSRPDAVETWSHEAARLRLADLSLSCSAVADVAARDADTSDLIDPVEGRAVAETAAYAVVAADGATAEALSTALCAMGGSRAEAYTNESHDLLAAAVAIVRLDPPNETRAAPSVTPLVLRRPEVLA